MSDAWSELAAPLVARLDRDWTREDEAVAGLQRPNMRIFAAKRGGMIEHRKRFFRRGWWLRLAAI